MELTRISTRKIYEEIADQIKAIIVSGDLRPGEKLPSTRELSERLQVGRSTVREALSALKAMGLLEIRQGEGCYVRKADADLAMPQLNKLLLGRDTVLELLEARKSLELSNAAIAAEKRSDADLQEFADILAAMKECLGDESEGEKLDMRFHRALSIATHNSIMVRLLETISGKMELAIRETRRLYMYSNKAVSAQLLSEHDHIFAAVRSQDAELAQEAMKRHLQHVEMMLLKYL